MKKKGQGLLEYAILLSVVLAAFMAMSLYVQRAAQANVRLMEEMVFAKTEYAPPVASVIEAFDLWEAMLAILAILFG